MRKSKKVLALMLSLIMLLGSFGSISASAVSNFGYNIPENSGDYAYWNGSKVVKSSSTTKDEIRWMQAALNKCISSEGLKATKLTIDGSFGPASKAATIKFQQAAGLTADGSFGPATIKKMKAVLDDGKVTFKSSDFKMQNILQVDAKSSSNYISGSWYKYSNGNCSCCENAYNSEYGEHEYIQGGGCGIVSLVSAIYNLGNTISKDDIGTAIKNVLNWGYETKTSSGVRYWQNGVKNRNLFNKSDEKFGSTYNFTISDEISGTSTDTKFVNHLKNGGTAVVHVYGHFMAVVDYKVENGKVFFLVFDPAPGSGTYWNSTKRSNITSPSGNWISQADLKNDGGSKGAKGSKENIEIDSYWLVSAK